MSLSPYHKETMALTKDLPRLTCNTKTKLPEWPGLLTKASPWIWWTGISWLCQPYVNVQNSLYFLISPANIPLKENEFWIFSNGITQTSMFFHFNASSYSSDLLGAYIYIIYHQLSSHVLIIGAALSQQVTLLTQRIHFRYIDLHLVDFDGKRK